MPLLSKGSSRKHNQEAETRGLGQKNFIPPGVHLMKVTGIEARKTKGGDPALVETIEVKGYDPLQNWLVFINEESVAWSILAKQLQTAGTSGLPDEVDTIESLAKHVSNVLLGKPFKVNIYHEKRIYKKTADQWYVNIEPRMAYIGAADEEMTFDPTKSVKELSIEQQEEWNQYLSRKGGQPVQQASAKQTANAPATAAATDDLDDLDEAPAPKKKPAAEKPVAEAPASSAHADLDELD